jgi:hypothetical protein
MLRKVEQTACAVLDMFPDLELAVEEGEWAVCACVGVCLSLSVCVCMYVVCQVRVC